ncbi:MAG: D-alanyl-D-alanine carboxypeptidase [Clostridiales bacterium]|nr:D-alanyl-D-alanine carboxypeptidase [Clostridiales bacterium]
MKRLLSVFVCAAIFLAALSPAKAGAAYNSLLESLEPYSEIVYLQSLEDGTVIFEKNADVKTASASLTKLVTALVTLNNCDDINTVVTVPDTAINVFAGTNSSTAGLKPGERLSVLDLLYCMLVPSANEAAEILAEYIGNGSTKKFVGKMNELVKSIGCTATHFTNPHGLDEDNHYTTARDMAKIASYTLTCPQSDLMEKITSTVKYTLPATNLSKERVLRTTNYLMNPGFADYYCKYVTGMKTGSTQNAGKCVIAKASCDGYSYLAVVLRGTFYDVDRDGYKENGAFMDAKKILEWTFANIKYETVLPSAQVVAEMPVKLSTKADYVAMVPDTELSTFVPSGVGESSVLVEVDPSTVGKSVDAPVKKGQKLGEAVVYYAGEEIARTDLVAAQDVGRNIFLYFLHIVKRLFSTIVFRIVFSVAVIIITAYAAVGIIYERKRRQRKRGLRVLNLRDIQKK